MKRRLALAIATLLLAGATTAVTASPAAAAPPELCTAEQEAQGAVNDAVAKGCHADRANSAAARGSKYLERAYSIKDGSHEEEHLINELDQLSEVAGTAAGDADNAETAADAAEYARKAASVVNGMAKAVSDMTNHTQQDTARALAAETAYQAARQISEEGTGRNAALNVAADTAEKGAQAGIDW
ncbi:hypothetical protein [Streptomyces sp. NRRL B-1347]|uniref:hypothetical protein n=1 Tax=Streptomyces sp. NRRL B-1347 TaxID=1476877 RepID=UPI0004CACFE1|nr:hypothetical protein [Streptomyces sp. NRRL B-1347]